MKSNYIKSVTKQFEYYKVIGEKTFVQLSDEQLFLQFNDDSNSVGTVVKHLSGNMLSRWTDFLTSDGEKIWRDREAEFKNDFESRTEMLVQWNNGWVCLFATLASLKEEDLVKIIYIRNEGHTVMEAINRQLAHYSYHIGQIVYLGKMLCQDSWQSLSIPKGYSLKYNKEKFSKDKTRKHFTDELFKNNSLEDEN